MNKENNILLAEFMGIRPYKLQAFYDNIYTVTNHIEKPCFHNSWDWLMGVVEKIENIETKDGRTFTIDMHRDSVLIFEYGTHTNEVVFTEGKGRLENLYNACVEFVEWLKKEEYQKAVINSIDLE